MRSLSQTVLTFDHFGLGVFYPELKTEYSKYRIAFLTTKKLHLHFIKYFIINDQKFRLQSILAGYDKNYNIILYTMLQNYMM